MLIGGVPEAIAGEGVKSQFLKQRNELLTRIVNSELKNKKISEWTMKSMNN